jgi:hypothetical protein
MNRLAHFVGFEVPTHEAVWVCVSCDLGPATASPDQVDYFFEFEAREPRKSGVPDRRTLQLRTSGFRLATEPGFADWLGLVVTGQMIETDPWNRFFEVYERS